MSTLTARHLEFASDTRPGHGPPAWLFVATAILGIVVLAMALAETNLWMHYLIDGGEYVSLVGLVFIAGAGVVLHREHRLMVSLPLAGPWLLFPLITQGDQIIDNLSITPMRIITHLLLAAIFATPVGVVVFAARSALPARRTTRGAALLAIVPGLRPLAAGHVREGTAMLAATLFVCEMWLAVRYLGALMIGTLILMILAVLWWGSMSSSTVAAMPARRARSERSALIVLMIGVAASFGLYIAYKNRPGAYQGSPSFLMDPRQHGSGYRLDQIAIPRGPLTVSPSAQGPLHAALSGYGRTLRRLLDGYYILDRNYTWHFHNELFLRDTPLLPGYRTAGLQKISEAGVMRIDADTAAATARAALPDDSPAAALLDDVRAYVAFNFDRAARLEALSAGFEQSPAGLQHAAHLYEGEGKVLGMVLSDILVKHRRTLESPGAAAFTGEFGPQAREIADAYDNRVVGF